MRSIRRFNQHKLFEKLGISEDVELLSNDIYKKLSISDNFTIDITQYKSFPKSIKQLIVDYNPNYTSSCSRKSNDIVLIKLSKKVYTVVIHEVNHIYTVKEYQDINKFTNKHNAQYTTSVFPHSDCTLYHLLYLTFGEEINSRVAETYVALLNTQTTKSTFANKLKFTPMYVLMKNAKHTLDIIDDLYKENKSEYRRFVYYYNISTENIKNNIVTDNTLTWKNILNMALSKFKIVKPYDESSEEEFNKFIKKFKPLMYKQIDSYFRKVNKMYDLMDETFSDKGILNDNDRINNIKELMEQIPDKDIKSISQSVIDESK